MEHEVHGEVSDHRRDKTAPPIQIPEQNSDECISQHRRRNSNAVCSSVRSKLRNVHGRESKRRSSNGKPSDGRRNVVTSSQSQKNPGKNGHHPKSQPHLLSHGSTD